ncbi:MAG: citrate lyase holo-[acyl-carrier protein] synthase [Coprococcus sp.]
MDQNVSVMDMMDAREYRQRLQRQLLNENRGTLISFTLNIPGPVKTSPDYQWAFEEGIKRILRELDVHHEVMSSQLIRAPKTGYEYYGIIHEEKNKVKRWMCEVEEQDRLGRIFDIDVLGADFEKADRSDIGLPPRECLLCSREAKLCGRSRTHSVDSMLREIRRIIMDAKVERALRTALLGEVYTTPKPGLVDLHDTGAHKDMTVATFEKSTEAIIPWLVKMFDTGHYWNSSPDGLFPAIKPLGLQAERAMLKATNGVNAHKGAIFTLGILTAAAGYCYGKGNKGFDSDLILNTAAEMTCAQLKKEYTVMDRKKAVTNGEILYQRYGEKGIRGEVEKGFPVLKNVTLPVMKNMMEMAADADTKNELCVQILLLCIVYLTDTNVLSRSGFTYDNLYWLQKQAADILKMGGAFSQQGMAAIAELNQQCIEKNISPGGCADMLAATIYLTELEQYC